MTTTTRACPPGCPAPRHDTYSGYRYGCRSAAAREEFRLYQKRRREGRHIPRRLDATGTIRRIQALWAIGHSSDTIGKHAGLSEYHVQRIVHQAHVNRPLRDTIVRAYRDLAQMPGTSDITRKRAQRAGYPSPLAWDEHTIDDANARPDYGSDSDVVDEVAIRRALAGERVPLTPAERDCAFRVGMARGLTAHAVGNRLHLSGETARRIAAQITQAA
ncbi:hypothetical protein [Micromonospora sp. NPDC001898]|uniref:hypothetical protein n=1 Tax=Micromonospora sp. NPDC001898 TaxID=3364221 RepID=UPI00368E08C7